MEACKQAQAPTDCSSPDAPSRGTLDPSPSDLGPGSRVATVIPYVSPSLCPVLCVGISDSVRCLCLNLLGLRALRLATVKRMMIDVDAM